MTLPEPNPDRINACPHCGSYRADNKPPYLDRLGCPKEHDPQIDRWVREHLTGEEAHGTT